MNNRIAVLLSILFTNLVVNLIGGSAMQTSTISLSPESLALSPVGEVLYIAELTAHRVDVFDLQIQRISSSIPVPARPTGLAISPDGNRLYVTCSNEQDWLCIIDGRSHEILTISQAGRGARSPVIGEAGKRIYICNQLDSSLSLFDGETGKELKRIDVGHEPFSAALSKDGLSLYIAHRLPAGPSIGETVAACISIVKAVDMTVEKIIPLPNGSTGVNDLCFSPDGRYVFVVHLLAHYQLPTTQIDKGWMNTNVLSILDTQTGELRKTVLLDDINRGAANPWKVSCTPDGEQLCVTHAGTHDISLIDLPKLFEKAGLIESRITGAGSKKPDFQNAVSSDLTFLAELRRRIPILGKGPRGLVVTDKAIYVSNFFSDTLNRIELSEEPILQVKEIALSDTADSSPIRLGEMLFHDASQAFQGWQSCASCHPDARSDGLNWDLLNDGIGNPKNTKSLVFSHQTPPAMSVGVRETAEEAVRSGFHHILFVEEKDEQAKAIDAYLQSLHPQAGSIGLAEENRELIRKGIQLFYSKRTHCSSCHNGIYYTDLQSHDVGTRGILDRQDRFDNPTLREVWRTAPYLHDGRATTLRDVLIRCNPNDRHGHTSSLSEEEIAALEAFLLSL